MTVPVLTYGSENWAMNRSDRRMIETAEMKFLRYVSGYTLRDHIKSDNIRKRLNIFSLNNRICELKNSWHQHIIRMSEGRTTKAVYLYRPIGHREVGRRRRRWEDDL